LIRIILADDHRIVREGLRALLSGEPDMTVIAEADNGRKAVSLAQELRPDLVIMDVSMPDLNGIEATHQILARDPLIRVIALSIHSDRRFVLRMFEAGAAGYLLKDCAYEELTRAIRVVAEGDPYLSQGIAGLVLGELLGRLLAGDPQGPELTGREREVLQLITEGHTTKQIASKLKVSVKTVETHRRQIMDKVKLNSVAELTKYAIREGLTSL
jgi:DNA-binding NarL/FixJ family response regulator